MATRNQKKQAVHTVADVPDRYVLCRSIQHAWKYTDVQRTRRVASRYIQTLSCARCGVVKDQHLDAYGEITKTTYHYPEGYVIDGLGHISSRDRGALRLRAVGA